MFKSAAVAALSVGTCAFPINRMLSSCSDIQIGCQNHWCANAYWESQCLKTCGKCGNDEPPSTSTSTTTATPTTTTTDVSSKITTAAPKTVAPTTTTTPDSISASCEDIQSGCQLNWCGDGYWRSQCLATCGACENDNPATTTTTTTLTSIETTTTTLASIETTTNQPSPITTKRPSEATTNRPSPDGSISEIISQEQFDYIFAERKGAQSCAKGVELLSYDNFVEAAKYYPTFGFEGTDGQRKREVAAFLGQISQETTGWWSTQPKGTWGLCFVEEVGCESGCPQYSSPHAQYPPVEGQSYHGRGAIQISHNYNYGQLSEVLYGDKNVLLENPDLLASDGVLAFRASLWFWMTAQNPKPSSHDVMIGVAEECPAKGRYNGFGMTTNIINGGLECTIPTPQKVENRVAYFKRYAEELGVTTGDHLYCNDMLNFNYGGC